MDMGSRGKAEFGLERDYVNTMHQCSGVVDGFWLGWVGAVDW